MRALWKVSMVRCSFRRPTARGDVVRDDGCEVVLRGATRRDGSPILIPLPGFPNGAEAPTPAELHIVLVRKGYL